MILAQEFRTNDGAAKRARFETFHAFGRYVYSIVRFHNGARDPLPYDSAKHQAGEYRWRLERRKPSHLHA